MKKILLTSFDTWLPHQSSNSSDDLLSRIRGCQLDLNLYFLHRLPVNIHRASERAIACIEDVQPEVIICCGMAESRYLLSIESHASWDENRLDTKVDLAKITNNLKYTFISHNAGRFVCEGLYYQVLKYLEDYTLEIECIFVHVPVLKFSNYSSIITDFKLILQALSQ